MLDENLNTPSCNWSVGIVSIVPHSSLSRITILIFLNILENDTREIKSLLDF